ncbi:MAG: hypothetical protein LBO20_00930, partial [Bifidobacteriaceae bacterium]|nr:hypothetical protein [Bifidobacteriaceae bacterium]
MSAEALASYPTDGVGRSGAAHATVRETTLELLPGLAGKPAADIGALRSRGGAAVHVGKAAAESGAAASGAASAPAGRPGPAGE